MSTPPAPAPPFIVYDVAKLTAAMRVQFPDMPEHVLDEVVRVGAEVAQLLSAAREVRIKIKGTEWRGMDCIGEALAIFFNLTSLANGGPEAQRTLAMISYAVRSVYGRKPAEPAAPATTEPEDDDTPKPN